MTDVAVHYAAGDELCSEQVELISVLRSVSPSETCCQLKPLAWSIRPLLGALKMQMETLNSIFLGCGKPARRTESRGEHISAAGKMGDASEWSPGEQRVLQREVEAPSTTAGEAAGAERSWTRCLVSPG